MTEQATSFMQLLQVIQLAVIIVFLGIIAGKLR